MKREIKKIFAASDLLLERLSIQRIWRVLAFVSAGIAIWFSSFAIYQLFQYWRIDTSAPAVITKWGVKELSSSRFVVEAFFEFEVEGTKYHGQSLFDSEVYLNPFSAQESIRRQQEGDVTAWYQPSNPQVSSLKREFPVKECIHALLTAGVFAYFACIPRRVSQFFAHDRINQSTKRA
jgi:hypothetical protein